jgi:hypothetical protein
MALIKFGGGVAGISGKIGGTVYGRNKAGAYARNWAKPVNPVTLSQAEVRARFQTASAGWSALTKPDRDAWNAAASLIERVNRFGETYIPSGRQYFMEINNSVGQAGLAAITAPPVSTSPPDAPAGLVLTSTAAGGVLTVLSLASTGPNNAGVISLIIEAAPLTVDTKTNVNTQYRQITVEDTGASPYNILAAYTSLFGNIATGGESLRMRVTSLNVETGYRSASVLIDDTV